MEDVHKPLEEVSDEALVKKIVATKDDKLFGVLYDRYAHFVFNRCLQFAESKEEAQDLTHDIFVLLFVKLKTFNGGSRFSTWLYSITYNHCINTLKKKNKTKDFLNSFDESQLIETVEDQEIFQMKSKKLQKALELMDQSEKAILLMKYQDDLPIKEIQKILEIGQSAVKMRLNRAKHRLINIYKNLG